MLDLPGSDTRSEYLSLLSLVLTEGAGLDVREAVVAPGAVLSSLFGLGPNGFELENWVMG